MNYTKKVIEIQQQSRHKHLNFQTLLLTIQFLISDNGNPFQEIVYAIVRTVFKALLLLLLLQFCQLHDDEYINILNNNECRLET